MSSSLFPASGRQLGGKPTPLELAAESLPDARKRASGGSVGRGSGTTQRRPALMRKPAFGLRSGGEFVYPDPPKKI